MAQPDDRPVPRRTPGRRAGRARTDLLEVAAQVIAERGADATRFVDVSAACGVPVSSLQYYFGSREDLLVAAFRHASDTELTRLRTELAGMAHPWDQLVHIVDAALGGFADGTAESGRLWVESWRFALRDPELRLDVMSDYSSWRALVESAVMAGKSSGAFDARIDPARVALQAIALMDGIGLPAALGDERLEGAAGRAIVLDALASLVGRVTQSPRVKTMRSAPGPS
jgi:AcrR family transcriptional regulator